MWAHKTNNEQNISEFFKGMTIFSQLQNSIFGQIKYRYEQVFSENEMKEYVLPTVIVIGTESSGKSSLLERITKCQIFPRESILCTKFPIKVTMATGNAHYMIKFPNETPHVITNKHDIHHIIQKYMQSYDTDYISQQEVHINITDIDTPNFVFYDLPGIRTHPQTSAAMTTRICKKYMSNKNSIILCVAPCTTTRLTSCQSIALIKKMNMEQNTILVLTMTDRLQPDNIVDLLVNRLINKTGEFKDVNFANYIAVINRSHTNNVSLEETDINEKKWFNDNIYSCIPEDFEQHRQTLINKTTIHMLLKNMDVLYNQYIQNEWAPRMITAMKLKINKIISSIEYLGPVITEDYFNNQIRDDLTIEISISNEKWYVKCLKNENIIDTTQMNMIYDHNNVAVLCDNDALFSNMSININVDLFPNQRERFHILNEGINAYIKRCTRTLFNDMRIKVYANNFKQYVLTRICTLKDKKQYDATTYFHNLLNIMFCDCYSSFVNTFIQHLTLDDFKDSNVWNEKKNIYINELASVKEHIKYIYKICNMEPNDIVNDTTNSDTDSTDSKDTH